MKVLFLGNSFTFYNEMPTLFENMVKSAGIDIKVDKLTFGGHYLHQYACFEEEKGKLFLEKLNSDKWDIVVLQDQSFNPANNYDDFFESSKILCKEIRKHGATPVFYQTWAYRNDSEKLAKTGLTYYELYSKLEEAYQKAAQELDTIAVPVGKAFYNLTQNYPDIELFQPDDFHPSPAGSMLAAAMFVQYLIKK